MRRRMMHRWMMHRWMMVAGLLSLLGGCWDWSVPLSRMNLDSGPTGDVGDGGGSSGDGDLSGDLLGGDLSAPQCTKHAECTAGLCTADGRCPDSGQISYVDDDCGAVKDGSKANPYCQIKDALGKPRKYILVKAGSYGDLSIDASHEIYGEPGATITPTSCATLAIGTLAPVTVLLAGFTIEGQVNIEVDGTAVTLIDNTIGPSACIGVRSWDLTTVTLRRNLVQKNTGGGINLDCKQFTVTNNYILGNGSTTVNFGGVRLKQSGAHLFINNTVADNVSRGFNDKEAGGVRCETANTKLVNSILWGNTPDTLGRQYRGTCEPEYCDVQETKAPGTTNTNVDPGFSGTGAGAAPYHISASSQVKDKGTSASAPAVDFDGDKRDDGSPDIGADEVK